MATPLMHGVLDEMNQQAVQISGVKSSFLTRTAAEKTDNPSFSEILMKSIGEVSSLQLAGKEKSEKFITGQEDIGLNDVMLALQKSSVSLNLGVQVRNKLISAYQDIMNMAV